MIIHKKKYLVSELQGLGLMNIFLFENKKDTRICILSIYVLFLIFFVVKMQMFK